MRVSRVVLLIMVLVALTLGSVSCDLFKASGGTGGGGGGAPAVPTGLSVGSPLPSSLQVTWNSSSGATSYQVYRDTVSPITAFAMQIYDSSGTSVTDSGLASSTAYYYYVQATNSVGSSSLSAAAIGATQAATGGAPGVPAAPTFSSPAPILTVSWIQPGTATSYLVYRDTSSTGSFNTLVYAGSSTSFVDIPAPSGGTYYYKVQATNSGGSSSKSVASSVVTIGTNSWQPFFGVDFYATNDTANYGYYEWKTIGGSVLSLGGTLDTIVTKFSGSIAGDIGVIFDYVDSTHFWWFSVDYTSPPGWYSIYKISGTS